MPLPRIAIVGRPNVGKSSLMNMIAAAKVSIVDPSAGTTRDRVTAILELPAPFKGQQPKVVEIVDTGGFGAYVAEGARFDEVGNDLARLSDSIEFQIQQAVEGADVVLLAVDAQAGITPLDREIARLLREHRLGGPAPKGKGKRGPAKTTKPTGEKPARSHAARPPIHVVATKVDGPKWESHAHELSGLGFGPPLLVSAKNNYFRREFLDHLWEIAPIAPPEETRRAPADLYVAIVGKRNAGKSTLVNTLAGEPRMIVSEIAGTTRDAVDVRFEFGGRTLVAIDTAGLRKKKSFQNMIEVYALDRLQRAVDRADVVLLLLDATEKISQVDEQVAMMAQKSFKPAIVLVNKWDLAAGRSGRDGRPVTTRHFEDYVRGELKGLAYAPIAFVSGESGLNVRKTIDLAFELREQSRARVTTGKLNRLVRGIVEQKGPPDIRGRFAKVYYVAQTGVEPPTITLVVNHPEMFTPGYLRFLTNRFREELPYSEVPIRIVVRERRQREDDLVAAEEGGKGATIRVVKGRKGVKERLAGRLAPGEGVPADAAGDPGDRWLDDDLSKPVEIDQLSEDPDDYFDDDE